MKKDSYEKEGYIYIFDYYWGRPIYYTPEEYAILQQEEERKTKEQRLHILEQSSHMNIMRTTVR